MLLGFKRRFEPMVSDGSKTHTIRAKRKDGRVPKPGETCHCYVDPRRKTMRLLGRWQCVRVEEITINRSKVWPHYAIWVDGLRLDPVECNALAWRDGFRNSGQDGAFMEMMSFWAGRLPFEGHVIHWAFTKGKPDAK